MVWLFPHETAKVNPPYRTIVDETCSGGDHDLNDHVYLVHDEQLLCSGCVRDLLVHHFQNAMPNDLDEYPFEVVAAERCDNGCGLYRCACSDRES